MGENEGWLQPPNGLLPNEGGSVMRVLDNERWGKAEERTAELIACIQPNAVSEERRSAVAVYVQKLIMKCFPCQVFTFGSVPLKTYLPDGDIDLTAFSYDQSFKETWANQVRDALENEERNEKAEFRVKEVQYIQAEVKIIKCLVGNIVVDISFNQLGGLCTLCFLEQVDKLINQNHLFKRSIILIKAWCYYESRILGAHHGLISTYALETLVLYIFHVFNTFSGPLEVLYRFLEFFSKFDWDNFCVSLWGPVPINLLPDATAAEPPRKDGGDLLLTKLFLDACSLAYSVSPPQEHQGHSFISKHFNIIDPLRANNNLGRSVSKGNFSRIRSAFAFGAKSLARVLECPKEDIFKELNQFFANTWDRHGSGPRPDAPKNDKNDASFSLGSLSEDSMNKVNRKRGGSSSGRETQVNGMHRSYGTSSHHVNVSVESSCRSRDVAEARALEQKRSGSLHSSKTSESFRPANSSHGASTETVHKKSQPDNLVNDVPGRHHFARTSSSPELTKSFGLFHQVSAWAPSNSSRSNRGPRDDDYADTSMHKENLGNELCYEDKRESPRSYSSRISVNSRTRVEGSREVSTAKFPNPTRDKRERKCPPSLITSTSSEHSSNLAEGNSRIQHSLSAMVTEIPERSLGPQFVSSLHDFRLQISEHEWAPSSGPDIVAPAAQVSPGSNQRVADNSGALPFAFYPAGPPVPFVMVPVYNLPTDTENADVSSSHFSSEEGMVNYDSGQNLDSPVVSDQPDFSSSSSTPASAEPVEHHSDILNGDFASHLQNLQFGRLCQNSQIPAPLLYPSPMMAPPVNVQGHYSWEGPGRPTSTNPNLFNQFMTYRPRLVPVTPLQPSSSRPAGFYQHYIDEIPRYRNGTGTYLPNPASLREQHSRRGSNRSQNASCNRSDHADRERNSKTGSKPRNTGPSKNPGQRHVYPGKSRAQAPWDPNRHESLSSPDSQNSPVMDSECCLSNLTYGVHPSPAFNLNGMSSNGPGVPPLFMFYPYDHTSYRTTAEQLKLGSVGSEGLSGSVDTSPLNEGTRTGEAYEEQKFDGVTARQTSPDQPSSPHC